jgi:chromate transporter
MCICGHHPILPAPYFNKYGKHPSIKAFVDGITAPVVGALAGAVAVITLKTIRDIPTAIIAIATVVVLVKFKKVKEPQIILFAALLGIAKKFFT